MWVRTSQSPVRRGQIPSQSTGATSSSLHAGFGQTEAAVDVSLLLIVNARYTRADQYLSSVLLCFGGTFNVCLLVA